MDEIELRVAAIETLLIDLLALADPALLAQLDASLRAGLVAKGEPGDGGDEQTIRQGALQLVRDGRLRHHLFTPLGPSQLRS